MGLLGEPAGLERERSAADHDGFTYEHCSRALQEPRSRWTAGGALRAIVRRRAREAALLPRFLAHERARAHEAKMKTRGARRGGVNAPRLFMGWTSVERSRRSRQHISRRRCPTGATKPEAGAVDRRPPLRILRAPHGWPGHPGGGRFGPSLARQASVRHGRARQRGLPPDPRVLMLHSTQKASDHRQVRHARGRHRLARGADCAAQRAHHLPHRALQDPQEGPPLAPRPAQAGQHRAAASSTT